MVNAIVATTFSATGQSRHGEHWRLERLPSPPNLGETLAEHEHALARVERKRFL